MTKKTKKEKKVQSGERKLYMLDCISIHKIRYCIEADQETIDNLENEFKKDGATELNEFSQDHLGEMLVSTQPIPDKETYLKMFDKNNPYLSRWDDDKKITFINILKK